MHERVIVIDVSEDNSGLIALINPRILEADGKTRFEEGCLSVPGIYEEVERAELLLHVRDAASPTLAEQRTQVEAVLDEIGVGSKPTLQVLNKVDLLPQRDFALGDIPVSGKTGEGLAFLLEAIDAALVADPLTEAQFRIPQGEGRVLASLERGATLSGQRFAGNLVYFSAVGPSSLLDRYRKYQMRDAEEQAPPEVLAGASS